VFTHPQRGWRRKSIRGAARNWLYFDVTAIIPGKQIIDRRAVFPDGKGLVLHVADARAGA
jgi:hypothetical protein